MNFFSYLAWHFSKLPLSILGLTRNYLIFTEHFFSIGLLLRTLFAPYRRQTFESGPGFSFSSFFETIISNLVSRVLGAIVRLVLIIVGLLTQALVLVIGVLLTIIFIFLPIITLPIYYKVYSAKEEKQNRHEFLKIVSAKPLPNFTAEELKRIENTPVGVFLFDRLSIPKNDIGGADLADLLKKYPVTGEDIYEVVRWFVHAKDEEEEYARFWDLANLLRVRPLGRDLAYGYTVNLDKYSVDLVKTGYEIPHLVGRRTEIDQIQRILARNGQNNVIITGDPGSGRHAIVLAFALDVFEGKVLPQLKNKRVLELNLNLLVSEAKVETEVKGKVDQVLKEATRAGNIILFIDNFERFVGAGKDSLDLTDVFSQSFISKNLQVIAVTDREAYHKVIQPNNSLAKIFEVVEVNEITKEDCLKVLEHLTPVLEKENQIFIPFKILTETIKKTEMIANVPYPEKAIDVVKEAVVLAVNGKAKILTLEILDKILSQKTKTPQGAILANEKEKLVNLEGLLHQHVVNQEEAILAIAQSLRRARLEISQKGKPIGSFLFLGPTGVGKTETAKTLARVYFGSEKQMIRLDMSQYQDNSAIPQLLGNPATNEPGSLTSAVRDKPFTVLLLDEIEKAGKDVLNLFLTILDEGYINDSSERRVSFENTIIIGTSNAGSEFIRQKLNADSNASNLGKELTEFVLQQKIFTPEFINRFDAVVVYKPLSPEHLRQIARLMLLKLNERLMEKRISILITEDLVNKIAQQGFDPQFGARPMKRVIQDKVEDYIAKGLLDGTIEQGEKVEIINI